MLKCCKYCQVRKSNLLVYIFVNSGCKGIPCVHGKCTDVGSNGFTCSCESGYSGKYCDTYVGKKLSNTTVRLSWKNSHYRLFNETPRTLVGKSWSVYLYFSLAHRRLGNFSSRETCIFNRWRLSIKMFCALSTKKISPPRWRFGKRHAFPVLYNICI